MLIRRIRHRDPNIARQALIDITRLPCSDAIILALDGMPHQSWGIEALGRIADPRASHALVRQLRQNAGARDDACVALSQPHHEPAVPALEQLALRDTDYHVVAAATKALAGIGTPGAVAALERFRREPARPLRYHDMAEDDTLVSSDLLGQGITATAQGAASVSRHG
ncbi:MAG TPA: HEAT repeat domain-containing protein [Vineibacter sp.]|nr:HEAT repeat domain-containing protein [Vineibacter sp.]